MEELLRRVISRDDGTIDEKRQISVMEFLELLDQVSTASMNHYISDLARQIENARTPDSITRIIDLPLLDKIVNLPIFNTVVGIEHHSDENIINNITITGETRNGNYVGQVTISGSIDRRSKDDNELTASAPVGGIGHFDDKGLPHFVLEIPSFYSEYITDLKVNGNKYTYLFEDSDDYVEYIRGPNGKTTVNGKELVLHPIIGFGGYATEL